jgi:hypothetical protein
LAYKYKNKCTCILNWWSQNGLAIKLLNTNASSNGWSQICLAYKYKNECMLNGWSQIYLPKQL